MSKPLAFDIYCGLGGWTDGLLAEGYEVIGFDIERHDYGTGGYPGQLVLQDARTIHGAQLKDAALIVASSPCQEFSYRAMPWKRAKALGPPVDGINLFYQPIRIQHEASEAAGRYIPLIQENVKGAQKWVGQAKAHYGSFYLWGDVAHVGGVIIAGRIGFGMSACAPRPSRKGFGGAWFHNKELGTTNPNRSRTTVAPDGIKNNGGSWFAIGSPGQTNVGQNPDGRKVPSLDGGRCTDIGKGARFTTRDCGIEGTKNGGDWFSSGANCSLQRRASSKSSARKAASAQIAKIPMPLAQYIARSFKPKVPA